MKTKTFIILLIAFLFNCTTYAQKKRDRPRAYINVVAKYDKNNKAVKLRILPDKKSILLKGMDKGFIIERALVDKKITKKEDLIFKKVGETYAFTESQWKEAMNNNNDSIKSRYEAAFAFYNGLKENSQKTNMSFAEMMKQKKSEDFKFVMLLLSAIQKDEIANSLSLGFSDKSITPDKKYVYRVLLKEYSGVYDIVDVPYIITTTPQENLPLQEIKVRIGDKKLIFNWEDNQMLSGIFIERKNKQTGKFEMLNNNPKYSLSVTTLNNGFEDNNLTNGETYEYRFYGLDAFGEKILFGIAKASPRDLTPPKKPLNIKAKHSKPDEVLITWEMPDTIDNDLNGFFVFQSSEAKRNYKKLNKKLLPENARSFTTKNFIKGGKNFYIIQAVDKSGNKSNSYAAYATLTDTIPPATPKFVSVAMDSLGIVRIEVKPNSEKDLKGYRLFTANNPEHEFSAIQENFLSNTKSNERPNVVFIDSVSLKSLTPYVYYRVKALDFHHNQSDFSETYEIKRIDTIPPTTPVIKNVKVDKEGIQLQFALSKSTDVKNHYLYRKNSQNEPWKQYKIINNNQTNFIDTNVIEGEKYYYSIRAEDTSNLLSDYSFSVQARAYKNINLPDVKNIKIKKNKEGNLISWKYPKQQKEIYFIIYKSNSKGKLVQYKRTNKTELLESNFSGNTKYAVRAFSKNGASSKISKIISN